MEIDRKRPSDGPVSEAKRPSVDTSGPVGAEDVEKFQKDALYRELTSLKRERDELQAQIKASQSGDESLRQQLADVTAKYVAAAKRADRLASPIVGRVTFTDNSSTNKTAREPTSRDATPDIKNGNSEKTGKSPAATERELVEVKSKLAASEAEVEKVREFIAVEDKKRQQLEAQVRELETLLASAPLSAQTTEQRLKDAYSETQRLAAEAQQLQKQIAEMKSSQAEYEGQVRERSSASMSSLEDRLAVAEADVVRIRSARDSLLSEVNILKAENAEFRNEASRLKELVELSNTETVNAVGCQSKPTNETGAGAGRGETDLPSDADGLRERCLALMRQNNALGDEISGLEQGFARASAKAKTAIKATAAAEQKMAVLNTAKVRSDEKYIGAMRARDALNQELQRTKAALERTAEQASRQKIQEQKLTVQLAATQKQVAQAEVAVQQRKHEADVIRRSKQEADGLLATLKLSSEKLREQLAQRDVEKSAADMARRNAETQIEKLKRQLEIQRAVSGLGSSEDIQEQLESLRSIAMCPVCQKNWKDRALTTCGHTLCNDCVQSRLTARMRKCPMCNGHFASNDVLTIHL